MSASTVATKKTSPASKSNKTKDAYGDDRWCPGNSPDVFSSLVVVPTVDPDVEAANIKRRQLKVLKWTGIKDWSSYQYIYIFIVQGMSALKVSLII